jgi:glycosyltransferase involved in cell wall biosynthesis
MITSTYPFGAGEEFFEGEVRGLIRSGLNVIILPLWPRGPLRQNSSDLKYLTLNRYRISPYIFLKTLLNVMYREIRFNKPAKVNLFERCFRESISAAYGPQLSKTIIEHKVSHMHAYWASGPAMLAMTTSKLSGISWSFTGHSGDLIDGVNLNQKIQSSKEVRLISERGARVLKKVTNLPNEFQIIHLGVRVPSITPIKKDAKIFRIACVANLIPIKNHLVLIKAMHFIASQEITMQLEIIGTGPLEQKIKKLVQEFDLTDSIIFRGQIEHAKLMEEYQQNRFQLVVLASGISKSGQEEGIPISLMEAMSYGIPVVSTKTGGIPELVTEDLDLLVSSNEPDKMAKKILEIITLPYDLRLKLSNQCYSRVKEDFNVEQTTIQFKRWFDSMLT